MSEEIRMMFLTKNPPLKTSGINERKFNDVLDSGGWTLREAQWVNGDGSRQEGWQCLLSRERPDANPGTAILRNANIADDEGDPNFVLNDMFKGTVPIPDDPEEEKD